MKFVIFIVCILLCDYTQAAPVDSTSSSTPAGVSTGTDGPSPDQWAELLNVCAQNATSDLCTFACGIWPDLPNCPGNEFLASISTTAYNDN